VRKARGMNGISAAAARAACISHRRAPLAVATFDNVRPGPELRPPIPRADASGPGLNLDARRRPRQLLPVPRMSNLPAHDARTGMGRD
jgi:hypothetical protein